MAFGHGPRLLAGGRLARRHQRGEVCDLLLGLGADLGPLGLAVGGGAAGRLLVGVGVAPALARLVLVFAWGRNP